METQNLKKYRMHSKWASGLLALMLLFTTIPMFPVAALAATVTPEAEIIGGPGCSNNLGTQAGDNWGAWNATLGRGATNVYSDSGSNRYQCGVGEPIHRFIDLGASIKSDDYRVFVFVSGNFANNIIYVSNSAGSNSWQPNGTNYNTWKVARNLYYNEDYQDKWIEITENIDLKNFRYLSSYGSQIYGGAASITQFGVRIIPKSRYLPNAPQINVGSAGQTSIGWVKDPVNVWIDGDVAPEGLNYYEYSLNGGAFQRYTGPFTVDGHGNNTIYARTVDLKNQKSDLSSAIVRIDKTAPNPPKIQVTGNSTDYAISLEAGSDDFSGISRTQYRIEGAVNQGWQDYYGVFHINQNGQSTVYARSIDNVGNVSQEVSKDVLIDNIAPDRPNILVNNINWASNDKQFTVQDGHDSGGSGVLKSQYKIGDGAWVDYVGPVIVSQENVKIYARTIDRAGNISQVTEANSNIDKTPPTTPTITLSDLNYTNKDILVTLSSGQDNLSGVQKTQYRIGNGNWLDYTEPFSITQEGRTTIFARSIDLATNISNVVTADAKIDRQPPSKPAISVSTKEWTNKDIMVTITDGVDAGSSDVLKSQYKIGESGNWSDYVAPISVGVENVKIYARTLDKAGNIGDEVMEPLRVDKTPPTKPVIQLSSGEWSNDDIQVSMTNAEDTLSGFLKNQYKIGEEGTWKDYDQQFSIPLEGQTMIYARAVDKAGNLSQETTKLLRIDKTPPTKPTISVSSSVYTTDDVTFQISGSRDDLSEVHYEYRINDGPYQDGDHGLITANGSSIITARAVDQAGNRSYEVQDITKVDKIPPNIQFTPRERDWEKSAVKVDIKYTDSIAGIAPNKRFYKVSQSSSSPTDWDMATSDSVTISIPKEGEWYLHAKASDNVGNVKEETTSYLRVQYPPEAPTLKVLSVREREVQFEWSLPNGQTLTDGYEYVLTNMTTGNTSTVSYPQNTFTDDSLEEGTEYDYVVQARNYVGTSPYSNKVHVLTLPGAVTNIRVDKEIRDPSKARISFDSVQSATYYNISAVNQETKLTDFRATVTGSVYEQIDNLQPGIIYDVSVFAVNPTGEGVQTHSSYLSLPDRATDFTSIQAEEDRIRLRWNTVSTATYYQLDRDATSVYKDVYLEYEDLGVQPGTEYLYRVAAENDTGLGGYSEYKAITLPAQVQNFRTVTADVYSLMTDWLPTKGAEGYNARVNGGPEIPLSADTQQFEFTSLPPGTIAELRIRPFNRSGSGKEQVIQSITLPQQPTDLKVEQIGEQSAVLNWKPQHGASKYKVKINDHTYVVSDTRLSVDGLEPGTQYTYSVQSGNAGGFGQPVEQQLLTLPSAPLLRVKSHTATTVTFTWDGVQSAHAYHVSINEDGREQQTANHEVTFDQLQPGVIYHFSARSENSTGVGQSNSYTHRLIPGALSLDDVKVIDVTEDSVTIGWKPAPGSDSTKVYVGDQYIGETTDSTFTFSGLESGKNYEIRLEPVNSSGSGPTSSVTVSTVPNADYTVSLKPDRYSIQFSWIFDRPNEIFAISYKGNEIYRGKAREFNWDGLTANTNYEFLIWTENESGKRSEPKKLETKTLKKKASTAEGGESVTKTVKPNIEKPSQSNSIVTSTERKKNRFDDIDKTFNKDKINELADNGILKGVNETTFEPNRPVTRVEFTSMLVRSLKLSQEPEVSLSFKDINPTAWYIDPLKSAIKSQVARGFSSTVFAPDQLIKREQAAKMVNNVVKATSEVNNNIYTDTSNIVEWAREDVLGLTQDNLVQGYPDGSFRPKQSITRAEAAEMIFNMLEKR
ncbi:OmpL47-type beta-barrel domain-containing protein [Paenibacillus polymyxa]|uniref:OmpL47-type beta-barrel domain-containing protein n=1 Tax=Paenibacillus polymyxa TaxID=1406 RepID=UPI000471FFEC|nr:fibronectin type III domain-containing protein [Paenibacillus polymyxa]